MTKAEFRQQRRALINLRDDTERKHQRALNRLNLIAAARPTQPTGVSADSDEWSNYLFDEAEWRARYNAAKVIADSRHNAFAETVKRLELFRPDFTREEDPGE